MRETHSSVLPTPPHKTHARKTGDQITQLEAQICAVLETDHQADMMAGGIGHG